jgi:hypothetical protein
MNKTVVVNANNLACELIYRLYKNALNDQYDLDCIDYDTKEITNAYYIYSSDCTDVDFLKLKDCLDIKLAERDYDCDGSVSLTCNLALLNRSTEVCNDLQLSIRT